MKAQVITQFDALTPVEIVGENLLVKRDDLLQPFGDSRVNGTKVRQCYCLLKSHLAKIRSEHNSTVATATSVHSPQGAIVARVAQHLGLKCIVAIAGKGSSTDHATIRNAREFGADVRVVSKLGYTSALNAKIKQMDENPFLINFGMGAYDDAQSIIHSTAQQVENIPKCHINQVILAVGSGIVTAGVLVGLRLFNCFVDRVYCVQIAGIDRRARIEKVLESVDPFIGFYPMSFDMLLDKRFDYSQEAAATIGDVILDPIYEAKAWLYMQKHFELAGRTLFWNVGNSWGLRR